MAEDWVEILRDAITRTVDGAIVTKFVVIAETIANNGESTIEIFSPDEVSLWDQLGMLAFATRFSQLAIEGAPPEDG